MWDGGSEHNRKYLSPTAMPEPTILCGVVRLRGTARDVRVVGAAKQSALEVIVGDVKTRRMVVYITAVAAGML